MTDTRSSIMRCPHGVYTAGKETAEYCTGCNPTPRNIVAIKRRDKAPNLANHFDDMDVAQFMELPFGARVSA